MTANNRGAYEPLRDERRERVQAWDFHFTLLSFGASHAVACTRRTAFTIRPGLLLVGILGAILASLYIAPPAEGAVIHEFHKQIASFTDHGETKSFAWPWALAVAEDGDVYVANKLGGVVDRLDAAGGPADFSCGAGCEEYVSDGGTGAQLTGAPGEPFGAGGVLGVAVRDVSGEVYVARGGAVDVFDSAGEYEPGLALRGTCENAGESAVGASPCAGSKLVPFRRVSGLAVDQATGDVYVGDGSSPAVVDVFNAAGEYITQFGSEHLCNFCEVTVGVNETAGDVYVGDDGGSVFVYETGGGFVSEWTGAGTPTGSFGGESRVAVDPSSGHVYVAAGDDGVVDELEGGLFGSEVYLGRITGTPSGGFTDPTEVAVSPAGSPSAGNVFVADYVGFTSGAADEYGPDLYVPGVKTEAATDRKPLSATLTGTVEPVVGTEGGAAECFFVYGASEAELNATATERNHVAKCSAPVTAAEHVTVPVGGLLPGTKYFYRLEATNTANGKTNTSEEPTAPCEGQSMRDGCFTTLGPKFETVSAREVASSSATLEAGVDPNEAATSVFFQYGRCTSASACSSSGYESSSLAAPGAAIGGGTAPVEVPGQHVQGLYAGSTYHFRAVGVSEIELENGKRETVELDGPEGSFTTQSPGEFKLMDGRQWEMVSPPQKEGALIEQPGEPGRIIQAAGEGDAFTYLANVPTEPGVVGYSNKQQVLSTRSPTGWITRDLSEAHGGATGASDEAGFEYRFFSENLSEAVVQPFGAFIPCRGTGGEAQPCLSEAASEQTAFLRTIYTGASTSGGTIESGQLCTSHCFRPLVTGCSAEPAPCPPAVQEVANVPPGTVFGSRGDFHGGGVQKPCPPEKFCGPFFTDASSDASQIVLEAEQLGGTYTWADGKLTPGDDVPGPRVLESADGSWVYFASNSVLAPGAIPGDCAAAPFSRPSQVCDVYVSHDGVTRLVALITGEDYNQFYPGRELQRKTPRVSPNGRWLAFPSERSLTGYDNVDVSEAESETYEGSGVRTKVHHDEELYLYHAPENLGTEAGTLTCTSCNPTGARPAGVEYGGFEKNKIDRGEGRDWPTTTWLAADVPGWTAFSNQRSVYQPRFLSDSGRVFFDAHDALVPKDINGTWDVYEYEPEGVGDCGPGAQSGDVVFEPARAFEVEGRTGEQGAGCVGLVSSGESAQESAFMDASESGGDVFFMTTSQLAPQDFDHAYDVYDAHECTASSPCIPPPASAAPECATAEACRAAPNPEPGIYGSPPSATFNGLGNLTPETPKPAVKVKALTRAQELGKALAACRRDRKKAKRRACEKRARAKYGTGTKGKTKK